MADPAAAQGRWLLILLMLAVSLGGARVLAQPAAPERPDAAASGAPRKVLERILAQPEFERSATGLLMERVKARVWRWVENTWDRLGLARLGSPNAATVFAWVVGLLALAALTVWLIQSLTRDDPRRALGLAPPASRRRTARAWARDSLAALQAGNHREAARCAYRAAVARLEEEGAWRQDDARTPREYLRLLPAEHRRRPVLADLTARFERAWYGSAAGGPDDARAMIARLEELGCLSPDHAI